MNSELLLRHEGKKKEFREILEGKDGKEIRQFRL